MGSFLFRPPPSVVAVFLFAVFIPVSLIFVCGVAFILLLPDFMGLGE
jgi:hypothetical protein